MIIYLISFTTYYDGGEDIQLVTRYKQKAFEFAKKYLPIHFNYEYWFKDDADGCQWINQESFRNKHSIKYIIDSKITYYGKQPQKIYRWQNKFEAVEIIEVNI